MRKPVQQSDVAPAARLSGLAARLWPDACQDEDSHIAQVMRVGQEPHTGTWAATGQVHHLPSALGRLLDLRTLSHLNITSSLVATALSVIFFSVQRYIALARSFIMPVSQLHINKFD